MDKKKGIIIAIVLLLLLSVGTFAFTRDNETEKLKDSGVSDKGNSTNQDSDTKNNTATDLEVVNGQEEGTPFNVNGANTENAGNNATAPVFSLDDIKVDRVEFAENFTMPEKTITDTDGSILTAVITYEYRANSNDEFEATTDFDTRRSGEYRVTYTITNKDGLSSSESFIVNVVDSVNPEITGTPVSMTNQDVALAVTELNNYEVTVNGKVYAKELVFTESGNYEVVVTDAAGNSARVTFTIDKDVPVLNFGNGAIVREKEIVVTDDNFDYMTITNYLTGETITVKENTYTLNAENSDNVRFNIKAYDKAGNVSKYADIYLDNVNPVIEGTGINNNEEKTLENNGLYTKVSLKVTDGSLKKVVLVKEDGEEVLATLDNNYTNNKMTFEKVFDQDGTYTIKAVDRNGNEEKITFTVDATAPTATLSMRTTEPTNKNLIVTMKTSESIVTPEGWTKVNDTTFTKKYTRNTTEEVVITDLVGNSSTVKVEITNIDKTAPEVEVIYSTTEPTNHGVFVNIKTNESVKAIKGWKKISDTEYQKAYSTNYTQDVTVTDLAGNTTTVTVSIKNIDKIAPSIIVTKSNNDRSTNQDVTVTLASNEAIKTPEGWTKIDDTTFTKVYSENGKYSVVVEDIAGNKATVNFEVKRIDKVAPDATITKSNNDKSTNQDVVVTLIANEAIKTPEGWTEVKTNKEHEFTKTYSENGKYSVEITDKAGNTTTVKFEVKRIDKVAPDATITKSNNDKSTNQDVIVTLIANEAIYKPEGWTEVKTNKEHEFTKTYSENGKYSVEITDKAGNKTTVKFEVKRIDKVAPVVTVVDPNKYYIEAGSIYVDKGYSAYDVVDKDVSNTIKISYSFLAEGTGNWITVDTLDTTKLGTYKVIYTANDKAGNSAKGTRVVVVRDTTAPVFQGYPESGFTDQDFVIDVEDIYLDTITISKRGSNEVLTVENGYVLKEEGSYILEAVDKSGNKARVNLGIDKTAPVVTGVENGGYYNTNVTPVVTDLQLAGAILVNGQKFTSGTEITEEGTYTLVANDRVGHTTTVTFIIDKTSPAPTKVQVWNKNNAFSIYIKNGETARVQATFTEALAIAPTLTIGTESKEMTLVSGGNGEAIYSADIIIPNDEAILEEGTLAFTLGGYQDLAGNLGEVFHQDNVKVTKNLIYDRTLAVVDIENINENGFVNTKNTQINVKDTNEFTTEIYKEGKLVKTRESQTRPDGTHFDRFGIGWLGEGNFKVVTTDKAGNVTEREFTVDATAPQFIDLQTGHKYKQVIINVEEVNLDTISVYSYVNKTTTAVENNTELTEDGTYKITATDKAGNSTMIYVSRDTTAPVITLNGESTLNLNVGDTYVEQNAIATDNIDKSKEVTPSYINYYTLNGVFIGRVDAVDTTKEGRYNIVYYTTDSLGNEAAKVTRLVYVSNPVALSVDEPIYTSLPDGTVKVSVTANKQVQQVAGWTVSEDGQTLTKIYTTNTDYLGETLVVKDLAGTSLNVAIIITSFQEDGKEIVAIASAESLRALANDINNGTVMQNKIIKLISDIDLSDSNWTPIDLWNGKLNGTIIDGYNHTISNMTVEGVNNGGFISQSASSLTIRNLIFDYASVTTNVGSTKYAGVLVGKNYSSLNIENVSVKNSRVENTWQAGGFVGFAEDHGPTFTNCTIENTFVGGSNATAGSLFGLGTVEVTINNCTAENINLYTDGNTWNSTQKQEGNYWVGHLYGRALTIDSSSTEINVNVVDSYE